jgi:hypothetical protein
MRYLTVDGMLSGTGIRDSLTGKYLDPSEVGFSPELIRRIEKWLIDYETATTVSSMMKLKING